MSILAAYVVPHPPLIVPEVGRGGEDQIALTTRSYQAVAEEIASLKPDTIVITSPHAVMYADYFHISPGKGAKGSFADFRAPGVKFEETYDRELVWRIEEIANSCGFPAGTLGERDKRLDHGTMVPLYFIRQHWNDFKLVRIGLSGLPLADHYRLGEIIREAANDLGRRVVFVASGDLSHKLQSYGPYGYAPEGPEYDERIMDVCGRGAFGEMLTFEETFCEKAAECGHRSFVIMAGAFDGVGVTTKVLSHEDVTGVGYGICTIHPETEDETRHFRRQYLQDLETEMQQKREAADDYVKLALASLTAYITEHRRIPIPRDLPRELTATQAGVFVSIHKQGKLRGCIGTIRPVRECTAREIIENAISAATEDPRFDPITAEELPWLEVNVDVLGDPEPIDSPDALDVKRYGVIVTAGRQRGLLLPDLDGVDTVEQQIDIARQKAGIPKGTKVKLERFEVIRHV